MKYQQKNYLFLVFALFMGCMVLFNSCQDDGTDSTDCFDVDCGEHGTCGIDNGLAVCFCDSSANGVLLYNGTNCENCIGHGGECPPNSHCTEAGCVCDSLYIQDPDGTGCIFDSTSIVDPVDTTTIMVSTRDLYLGTYTQTDVDCADISVDPTTLVDYATVDITGSSTEDNVLFFNNLSALGDVVTVTLREDPTRFEIPNQTTADGHVFEGLTIGTFNAFESGDTSLAIQYRLIPLGGVEDICTLTLEKQ